MSWLRRALCSTIARPIETLDERLARAVAAGQFRLIDPDFAVVDPQAEQGGQHVLDHLDRGAFGLERRAARRFESIGDEAPESGAGGPDRSARTRRPNARRPGRNSTFTSRPLQYPKPVNETGSRIVRCLRGAYVNGAPFVQETDDRAKRATDEMALVRRQDAEADANGLI